MVKLRLCIVTAAVIAAMGVSASAATVDCTSKVGTSQAAWNGSGTYNVSVMPSGATESVKMVERYYNNLSDAHQGVTPLHQTVTGLDDGKYTATLYATAFNAWKGDAGLGSLSMDAARIYAKSGDKTAGTPIKAEKKSSYTYDELINNYTYTVSIDVTGGTLELGLEIMKDNQCEWYSIQISKLEREVSEADALAAAKAAATEALASDDFKNVNGQERTALEAALNATDATADGINAALDAFRNAKPAYDAYANAVAIVNLEMKANYATDTATAYLNAVLGLTPETADDATRYYDAIVEKYGPWAISNAIAEKTGNALVTIVNPDAADGINGWTLSQHDGNGNIESKSDSKEFPTKNGIYPVTTYFDGGNWNGSDWTTDLDQTIVNLPAGKYRLAALGRGSEGTRFHYLYAGDRENENLRVALPLVGAPDQTSIEAPYGKGWGIRYVDFDHEGGDLTIGVWSNAQQKQQWVSYTHFTLVKLNSTTGIQSIGTDEAAETVVYDLLGRRVQNPGNGIYIVNGRKVLVNKH